jgi:hypothetical protein
MLHVVHRKKKKRQIPASGGTPVNVPTHLPTTHAHTPPLLALLQPHILIPITTETRQTAYHWLDQLHPFRQEGGETS